MKVKLKDGRTGILLTKGNKNATINIDNGGTEQVPIDQILEENNSGQVKAEPPREKVVEEPTKPEPQFGLTVDLLEPIFVRALIKALQHPDVIASQEKAAIALMKEPVINEVLAPQLESLTAMLNDAFQFNKKRATKKKTTKKKVAKKKAIPK